MSQPYYIIEHPTRGVLKDMEETASENVGRFSPDGLRSAGERFHSAEAARRALGQITPQSKRAQCVIRCSEPQPRPGYRFPDYWPVVA